MLQARGARRTVAARIPMGVSRDRKRHAMGDEGMRGQSTYGAVTDASTRTTRSEDHSEAAARKSGIFDGSTRILRCMDSAVAAAPAHRGAACPAGLRHSGGGEAQRLRMVALDMGEGRHEWSAGEGHRTDEGERRAAAAGGSCDGAMTEDGARDAVAQALALGMQERGACMRREEPREGDSAEEGPTSATSEATWLEGALPDEQNCAESCTNTGSVGSEGQGGCGEEAAEKPCVGCAHELYLE